MPVNSKHPDYDDIIDCWQLLRRSIKGQSTIRSHGELYLPKPPGQSLPGTPDDLTYDAYRARARFPNLVASAVNAFNGVIHSKDPSYELPERMQSLVTNATIDNCSLSVLHRRITREALITGRVGIVLNPPATNEQPPIITTYNAETIINWRVDVLQGQERLTMVVLDESGYEINPTDPFDYQHIRKYVVLALVDGIYTIQRFRENQGRMVSDPPVAPTMFGTTLDFIPFVFVGSLDLKSNPDPVILEPLAQIGVSIYQMDADYRQALYLISQPTLVISGAEKPKDGAAPTQNIGIGSCILLPQNGSAQYLVFSGSGIQHQREAINDAYQQATLLGSKLLEAGARAAESAEALRVRRGIETATLNTIARTSGSGIERILKDAAIWMGINPDEVTFEPNLDFTEAIIDANLLTAIGNAWAMGLISHDTALDTLRDLEIVSTDISNDDERERIAGDSTTSSEVSSFEDSLDDDSEG